MYNRFLIKCWFDFYVSENSDYITSEMWSGAKTWLNTSARGGALKIPSGFGLLDAHSAYVWNRPIPQSAHKQLLEFRGIINIFPGENAEF